jgi:hypothetical protein
MRSLLRSLSLVFTVVLLLSLILMMFGQALAEHSDLPDIEAKALAYVKDVLSIDFAHYNITCESCPLPESPNATYRTDAVTLMLNSSNSMLVINCMFRNGVQYTCDLGVQQGSPTYVRNCSNLLEMARAIIAGHQTQTGVDCSYLLKTLNMVTSTENVTTVTLGNVKLTVCSRVLPMGVLTTGTDGTLHIQADPSNIRSGISFHWMYTGGSDEQFIFSLNFDNGNLCSLCDERIISSFTISQVDDVTAESSINNTAESENGQKQPATQPQSEPIFSPLVILAVASMLGVAPVCVGIVFYHKRHLESEKPASIFVAQDETESF